MEESVLYLHSVNRIVVAAFIVRMSRCCEGEYTNQ